MSNTNFVIPIKFEDLYNPSGDIHVYKVQIEYNEKEIGHKLKGICILELQLILIKLYYNVIMMLFLQTHLTHLRKMGLNISSKTLMSSIVI